MKRNEEYILRNIADTFFLFPSDSIKENDKKLVFLNETSVFLWKKMEKSCTLDDLVKAISDQYDVTEGIALRHVADFISFLSKNGCLDLEEGI